MGQNLVEYLTKAGFYHSTLSRAEIESEDYTKIDSSEAIVHLAGKAHDLYAVSNHDEYIEVNFEITRKVYDAFLKSSCTKFIFVSSVKAVADHLDKPLKEDFTPNPRTSYGISKLMAERYIQDQPLPAGKSYYILRPCMIHGPGNKGNLNQLYTIISRGIPYPLAAFNNQRSFLSIENFCFVVKALIDSNNVESGVYNLADDESLSTNVLVNLIAKTIGRRAIILRVNPGMLRWLARIGDIIPLLINTEKLTKLTESYVVNNQKIKNAIGKVLPVSAIEGLERTLKSFR